MPSTAFWQHSESKHKPERPGTKGVHVQVLHSTVKEVGEKVQAQCTGKSASRSPLRKEKVKKEIKQFNPRFQEDFAQGKDYDVDRCVSCASRGRKVRVQQASFPINWYNAYH